MAMPSPSIAKFPPRIGVVTVGGCDLAVREALELLAEQGIEADYMRIRAFPFHESVLQFLVNHEINFVVEQNRDGQLRSLADPGDRGLQAPPEIGACLRRIPSERPARGRRNNRQLAILGTLNSRAGLDARPLVPWR